MTDKECICEGNWRRIIKEHEPLHRRVFMGPHGERFSFSGVMDGMDDYYYVMWSPKYGYRMLSCVGSLEGHGYTLVQGGEE